MVFGNLGNDSGTGVAFTRNPGTGEKKLYGEYLLNAQGEDVVAGIRTPSKISRLQEDLPQVHQQLLELSQQLEYHYRDVQDFEFTIEHGKIWLLQSRLAKRSARANLRNAIDLLDEGRISVEEAIFRVKPTDLEQILAPRLPSGMNIQPLARGLNASPGIVHGEAIFDAETADELATAGKKVILIVPDTSPDDIHGVTTSQGVVTSRGSATSHAAVACRSLNKPCVAGANIRINALEKHFTVLSKVVKEGDQLTIDGASGVIYEGIIPLVEVNVQDNPYLIRYMGLFESINTDDYVEDGAGILWLLRDTLKNKSIPSFITGSIPLIPESFELATEYISFRQPPQSIISNILSSLQSQIDPDTIAAIWGILRVLGSMLQNEIGIGNHYLAIRPLIDPLRAWIDLNSKSITSDGLVISKPPIQLVGIEFFGINRFLRHYLPWSDIQWWSLIRLSHAEINYIWRLDNSNPRGESLVPGLGELIGFLVLLNGRCLTLLETKAFYNDLRKRAFGWNWYQEHNTSWREVIDTLQRYWHGSHVDKEVLAKYQDIGLLTKEWQLSPVGVALLLEQTAVQRRNITFAGRKLLDE